MQRKNFWAHTITVKVKLHTFDVLSRARTLPRGVFVQSPEDLVRHSTELLAEVRQEFMASPEHRSKPFSVRLLGIRCNNFRHEQETESTGCDQLNLDQFLLPRSTSPVFRVAAVEEGISARCDTNIVDILHDDPTFEVEGTNDHDDAFYQQHVVPQDDSTTILPTNHGEPITADCPVCGLSLPPNDNLLVNQHIDTCLSGRAVREAIREASFPRKGNPKSQLDYYFAASSREST
jgi:hypothetical protein